jgi:hypothetical protein
MKRSAFSRQRTEFKFTLIAPLPTFSNNASAGGIGHGKSAHLGAPGEGGCNYSFRHSVTAPANGR